MARRVDLSKRGTVVLVVLLLLGIAHWNIQTGVEIISLDFPSSFLPPRPEGDLPVQQRVVNEERDARELDRPVDVDAGSSSADEVHVVFSTGCSPFQDWQSYLFFHAAWRVGQKGNITRVASGCGPADAATLEKSHNEQIRTMSPNFHLHQTPDYTNILPGARYHFFNKAMGIQHWLTHRLRMAENIELYKDTVFVILDPDQIILRPFVADYRSETELWSVHDEKIGGPRVIQKGNPMSQEYGIGTRFKRFINMTYILNSTEDSPARHWNDSIIRQYYMLGPPYMAVGADFWPLVNTWASFVRPLHTLSDKAHISEMYAYVTAAAHMNLPHTTGQSFMISNTGSGPGEPWEWVDRMEDACVVTEPMPHTLHFCQRYFVGPWFFSKYQLPKNFLSCDHPLLAQPTMKAVDLYPSSTSLDGTVHDQPPKERKRNIFMLCHMIRHLNDAASHYKRNHCGADANFQRTFMFGDRPLPEDAE